MKRKKQTYPIEFCVNSAHDYSSHKLNILKECLIEWSKPDNGFYPDWDNFKYETEEVVSATGQSITVFHCYADQKWLSDHQLSKDVEFFL